MSSFRQGVRNLVNNSAVEADLDAELRSYVELLVAQKVKAGMTPDDARRAAMIEIGGMERVKDDVRDERPGMLVENALRDLRHGARLLRRSPGFAIVAILTIALGIGATSAIFSVINAVALKPLPYPAGHRLMFITSQFPTLNFDKFWVSPPEYLELRERTKSFTDIAAYTTGAWNVGASTGPERVPAAFITANMFEVLGVKPRLGQSFTPAQTLPNAEPVVILSDALWRRSFGGDPAIIGRQIEVQGLKRTVVGVTPPDLDIHDNRTQIWAPIGLDPTNRQNRGSHGLYLVARLKPDVTFEGAQADLEMQLRQWRQLTPAGHVPNDSTHRIQMTSLRDEVIGNVKNALWMLQGAVLLVLLIACANVANLLLVRAESRHKEFAVRSALGAGRGRILRQFFAEGLVLTTLGAILGLAFAYWGLTAILRANPDSIPRSAEIGIDPLVLLVTIAIAVGTSLIFGLAPLLHLGDAAVTAVIKEGGTRGTPSATRHRVRRGLVMAEIALAVMLVVGAGLLVRSFSNLTHVDAGFDPDDIVTFGIVMPPATYTSPERRGAFIADMQSRLKAIPGVQAVAAMQGLPPQRSVNANDTEFEGVPQGPDLPAHNVDYYQFATAGYFEAMRIPLVQGRGFESADAAGAPVIVINEATAKRFYKDGNALGRRMRPCCDGPNSPVPWFTIVGIAKDVKQGGLDQPAGTEMYFNIEQGARPNGFVPNGVNLVLRTSQPLGAVAPAIQRVVRTMDPALPIIQLRTMTDVFGGTVTRQRFLSTLLAIFGAVALTLAAIGTYGVVSYLVTERQREIGIRVALGADSGRVARLVLTQGLSLAVIGILAGAAGAYALSRLSAKLLFGVSPADPATYAGVAAVIAAVALIACMLPARRAMRVDPLTAIRGD
ncbi:MAG TPA: ABC transporter permease [Gemmatimonadaceae bacterium]|nr:ABC transporter permease [Gemmatimonadaceae bacterium]